MTKQSTFPAVFAYLIPIIGWLYVYLFQRKNPSAIFHLRQSIGLVLFLLGTLLAWAVVAYVLAIIPYLAVLSVTLFTIVIAAYVFGVVAWVKGMLNAFNDQSIPLPIFGKWASRLPIQ